MSGTKIIAIVAGAILAIFLLLNFVFTETLDYYEAVWDNTVPSYVSFRDRYPNGKYIKETNERKSLLEEDYFAQKRKKDDLRAYEEFLHAFPADRQLD